MLPRDQSFMLAFEPSLLNGVETISGKSITLSKDADGAIVKTEQSFKAIPYFAWANRGRGEMAVWFTDAEAGVPIP
jgi:DUF1680 family protein